MNDYRTVLEHDTERVGPASFTFDDITRRHDRKRRRHRVTAGVVGMAVFVAGIWIVRDVASLNRSEILVPGESATPGPTVTQPTYPGPTYTLGPVTPKDLALGDSFMDAWVGGDGEAAAAMFSPEGTFDGFQPAILPALHDWFRAEGWTFGSSDCGIHGWGPKRGVVGCTFTYENDLTRALGIPPLETTISFVTDAGGIETAWYGGGGDVVYGAFEGYRGREDRFGPVWDAYIEWISTRYPDEFVRIYDTDRGYPILDPTSIELWKRYTGEFVASPQAQALARSIADAGWDGVGVPPEGTAPSTPVEGELIADYAELHVGFVFVYADGRVISDRFGSGVVNEQRLTPEGVDLVRSGAVPPRMFLPPYLRADLPAGAYADDVIKVFVPSRYAVCFYKESGAANPGTVNGGYEYPSTVLRFFPAQARTILIGKDHSYERSGDFLGPGPIDCSEVTSDEARALDLILSGLRVEDSDGDEIFWEMHEVLPHGEWIAQYG